MWWLWWLWWLWLLCGCCCVLCVVWLWWLWFGHCCSMCVFLHTHARLQTNYGGRVPADTTPGPVPVYKAPKKSTPQLIKPWREDLVDELQLQINHSVPDTSTGMQHEACQQPRPKTGHRDNLRIRVHLHGETP